MPDIRPIRLVVPEVQAEVADERKTGPTEDLRDPEGTPALLFNEKIDGLMEPIGDQGTAEARALTRRCFLAVVINEPLMIRQLAHELVYRCVNPVEELL